MHETIIPPVVPPTDPGPRPETAGAQDVPRDFFMPALRGDPEAFPVLKAFQEYIEEERERARRRLATLSIVAISALVLVITGFLIVGSIVFGNLSRRNEQLQNVVMQAAVRDASAAVAPAPAAQGELSRLQDLVLRLQQDQEALQGSVGSLTDLPDVLAERLAAALTEAARTPVQAASARPPPPPAAAAPFGPGTAMARPAATQPAAPPDPAPEAQDPHRPDTAPVPSDAGAATEEPRPVEPRAQPPATATPPPSPAQDRPAPARGTSADRVAIDVATRQREPPRLQGYTPAQMTLVTDQGIAIPWRVVVPE